MHMEGHAVSKCILFLYVFLFAPLGNGATDRGVLPVLFIFYLSDSVNMSYV